MRAPNSGPIIRALWNEWVQQDAKRNRPVTEKLVLAFTSDRGSNLKAGTVMGWLGEKKFGDGYPVRLVQTKTNRDRAISLFCYDSRKPGKIDQEKAKRLWDAWAKDDEKLRSDEQPMVDRQAVPPDPSATWMPDESLKKSGDQALLCDLDIHKSQPADPQKPCLSVTLTCGEVLGRLDGEGGLPDLRYRLTVRKLEIQPTLKNAQLVPGSIAKGKPLRFTTRWHIDIKAKANELPLEGRKLADVEVLRPGEEVEIGLTVYCNDNDFVPEFIMPPPDYPDKELRVLEHVLKKWNLDRAEVRVPLAEGRLLAPKPTKK